jgi:hypothetical protein
MGGSESDQPKGGLRRRRRRAGWAPTVKAGQAPSVQLDSPGRAAGASGSSHEREFELKLVASPASSTPRRRRSRTRTGALGAAGRARAEAAVRVGSARSSRQRPGCGSRNLRGAQPIRGRMLEPREQSVLQAWRTRRGRATHVVAPRPGPSSAPAPCAGHASAAFALAGSRPRCTTRGESRAWATRRWGRPE